MIRSIIFSLVILIAYDSTAQKNQLLPYKNATLPIETRVKDLLSRMTPEEKFWQLYMIPGDIDNASKDQYVNGIFGFQVSASSKADGATQQLLSYNTNENALALAKKINGIQKYFVEKTRLGIPIIAFDEGLHGLVREGATSFPQSIALAATFDTTLMREVATAIAMETKSRGIRQILSPVINIASDVRWGRVEETYGEDPFLTSAMGVAYVKAFERRSIITTPKHLIANVGDGGRDSYPIHFNERFLEEIHFPPFKACFKLGGTRSVMTSYNSLDGTAMSAHHWMLNQKLKNEWDFKGFVISDANATGGSVVLHNTAANYTESARQAITGGLDVIFQSEYRHYTLFNQGLLDENRDQQRIDDAVSRVLRAKFELGLFENPYVSESLARENHVASHKALAKRAALESIVLLKNDGNILPFGDFKSIAVVGQDAVEARLGGYSGPGNGKVSILEGLKKRAKNVQVSYAEGCKRVSDNWSVVASEFLSNENGRGLNADYFNNITLAGSPAITKITEKIDFLWTLSSPDPVILNDFYSARWTGKIKSPRSGTFKIGLDGNDGFRLYINNELIINNWKKETYSTVLRDYQFEANKLYDIRVEFFESVGNAKLRLIWNVMNETEWKSKIDEAVTIAKSSDVAIVVAGIHEGEFQDRAMLSLPGHQEELINAVAETGKPVVVVLIGGSAIVMNNWLKNVDAVIDAWYPGEEGGHAVSEVLFGDYNPSGKLPITFPVHESQLPLVYNHKPTGRGDDYYNLSGLPLFPFGFGLSYTTFDYHDLVVSKKSITANESAIVSFKVTNSGKLPGDEVCQLYIKDLLSSVARPVMELKGFRRITLKPGETTAVSVEISPELLTMLDVNLKEVIEPGDFKLMIGSSSRDIRLVEILSVR